MNSNRRLARWPLMLAVPLALSACSITDEINERTSIDYKSAGKLPRLDVPPDLVAPQGDERFAIPDRGDRTFSGYQSARAEQRPQEATAVLPAVKGMRIERAGSQRWLVVDQPADRIWPAVKEFWQEAGFVLESESPATGIMETEWAENRAKIPQDIVRRTIGRLFESVYSTAERDKFRTRFERTAQGGTEIYISHRGMEEVFVSERERERTVWQPRDTDPELEAEFLRRLMVRLGADAERAASAVATASPAASAVPRVVTGGDADLLELPEGFDRAWRRIGLALDRGGFTVEDRDRSQGVYFVRYIDPELEPTGSERGLLSRVFSRGPSKPASAQQYRIRVDGNDSAARVSVLAKDGAALTSELDRKTARKILSLLRTQLAQ